MPQGWCFPHPPALNTGQASPLRQPGHSARAQSVVPSGHFGSPAAARPLAPPPRGLESFPHPDLLQLDLALPCSPRPLGPQGPCFPAPPGTPALQTLPQVWGLLEQSTLDLPQVPETPPPSLKMGYPLPPYLGPPGTAFQVPTSQHQHQLQQPRPQPAAYLPLSQVFEWQQLPCYRLPPPALPPAGAGGEGLDESLPPSPFELAFQSSPGLSLAELAAASPGI